MGSGVFQYDFNTTALFFDFVKIFILMTTPTTLLIGIFLLLDFDTLLKIEKTLSKTFFVRKGHWIEELEKSRNSFYMFLLKKRRIFGTLCILNSLFVFMASFDFIIGKLRP
jgi:hypothetical protein